LSLSILSFMLGCEAGSGYLLTILARRARRIQDVMPNGLSGPVGSFVDRHQFNTINSGCP